MVFVERNKLFISRQCRVRSDCMYVRTDLALQYPRNMQLVANGRVKIKTRVLSARLREAAVMLILI